MQKILIAAILTCALFSSNTIAQVKQDGKWHFPDSIKNLCIDREQNIISMNRGLIEKGSEWTDPNIKIDKSNHSQLIESIKNAIAEYETSWDRLGCAYIIYGIKK